MEPVDPCINLNLLPPGSVAVEYGKNQPEYRNLPTVRTPDLQVITRWRLTLEERRAIVEGQDVYVTMLTDGRINPFYVTVGPVNWRSNGQ